nr:transposase [Planomonospora venezuelensis]
MIEVLEDVARLGARLIIQTAVEAEVDAFLGRARYQRTAAASGEQAVRPGHRNGHCPTTIKTTSGPITIARPKLRGTTEAFASRLFGTGVTRTHALESLVIASFVRGLSVRDVEGALADALGPEAALSKSTVSAICQAIVTEYDAWCRRDLSGIELDYLFLDASHFKMHDGQRAEPVLAAWGITTGGKPVFVGLAPAGSESTAARTRDTIGTHPQLALGLVIDTPHRRVGPAAITALDAVASLGLPTGTLAVDRAYTDQAADHFARPARAHGYRLALDYKVEQRGLQGSVHGALLVDGTLACPLMPAPLVHATTGLDDAAVRAPDDELTALIHARRPYLLKVKQTPDAEGRLRLQCPAAGTAPSVNCPRFNQTRATARGPRTRIDLTDARQRAAHTAAKPTVLLPQTSTNDGCLPTICTQQTITLHPGDLGHKDKLRQDLPYLSPAWKGAFKIIRANTEGINGRLKGQVINLADPTNRLAHGRVAQTLLVALMVCVANQKILLSWRQVHDHEARPSSTTGNDLPAEPDIDDTTGNSGRPPPGLP